MRKRVDVHYWENISGEIDKMFILVSVIIDVKVKVGFWLKFNADLCEFWLYFLSALKDISPEVIFFQLSSRESFHGVPLIDLHVVGVVRLHPPPQVARDAGVAVPGEGQDDGEVLSNLR